VSKGGCLGWQPLRSVLKTPGFFTRFGTPYRSFPTSPMDPKPILVVGRIAEPSSAHTELYLYSLDCSRGVGRITVAEETSLNSDQQRIFGRVF